MAQQTNIVLTVNAKNADQVIKSLSDRAKELDERLKHLKATGQGNSKEAKKIDAEVKALNSAMAKTIDSTQRVEHAMKNLATMTTADLRRALAAARKELENMGGASTGREKLLSDMKRIQRQIEINTGAANKSTKAWNVALKNLVSYTSLFSAFNLAKGYIEDATRSLFKMSDQLADIRKVSGLTVEDIKGLSTELAKVDTRSSQSDLLKLSYQGAKLGIGEYGTEGLVGFTKAADQVNVALKEDLGDDALTQLAKFAENMNLIKKYGVEQAMLKAGSAMFQLSATSTASADQIVEFTKRMMAAGKVAGLTADQILALGSASSSMNLSAEVSSTAMSRFVGAIQTNHNLIESALHIEPGTINNLFSAGKMMDAMLLVMEKMQGKNMNQLDFIWKDLGSDGTRLKNVITSMVSNLPMLRKHLDTSNQAFTEGAAVTNEYNIQQQTAAALIERAGNKWKNAFVNSNNVDIIHEMAQAWYDVSRSMTEARSSIGAIWLLFETLKVAMTIVIRLIPTFIYLGTGIMTVWGGAGVARILGNVVFWFKNLRFSIEYATLALKALSTATKTTLWGLALGAAIGVVSWLVDLKKSADASAESLRNLRQAQQKLLGDIDVETARMRSLYNAMRQTNAGTDERRRLVNAFNKNYGQYLKNMLKENSSLSDMERAYKRVNKAIIGKLALEAKQSDYQREVAPRIRWEAMKRDNMERLLANSSFKVSASVIENDIATWIDSGKMTKKQYLAYLFSQAGGLHGYNGKYMNSARAGELKGDEDVIKAGFAPDAKPRSQVVDDAAVQAIAAYIYQHGVSEYYKKRVDRRYKGFDPEMNAYLDPGDPGTLDNQKPDKAAIAAAKKEKNARIKKKREDLKKAEEDSTAIISTIEEYYKLQETAIEQMVADGQLLRADADNLIKYNKQRMNIMLQQARLALAGDENNFDELRKGMGPGVDMVDYGAQSQKAMQKVQGLDVGKAHAVLARFDGDKEANSSAFLDKIRKNAAQNLLEATRIAAEQQQQIIKLLNQDDFLRQAEEASNKTFSDLGFTVSNEQFYKRQAAKNSQTPQDGVQVTESSIPYALKQARTQFRVNARENYGYNVLSNRIITKKNDDGTEQKVNEGDEQARLWWESFKNGSYTGADKSTHTAQEWMPAINVAELDNNIEKVKGFYVALTQADDGYYDAQNKTYDRDKKQVDERWSRSRRGEYYDEAEHYAQREQQVRQMNGTTSTAMQDMGLNTNILDNDPEIAMYELRIQKATEYYELVKQQSNDQKLIREAEQAQEQAVLEMSSQIADKLKSRMDNLQQTLDPLKEFSTQVGEAFVDMADDAKSGRDAIRNAAVAMVKSYAQMTLKMIAQQITQRIQRALFHKQMEKMEAKHNKAMSKSAESSQADQLDVTKTAQEGITDIMKTEGKKASDTKKEQAGEDAQTTAQETQGNAFAGIASGASKIIGKLGWWGIPLVAVITALLQGLLNKALSKLGGKSSSESANVNTKLVTGMLTYDSGNVRQFAGAIDGKSFPVVGSDGRVYAVSDAAQLETGLVTKPLLTTVGGQPSLVAERGPEMVIGRETTAAMMMSRPDLIREIVRFDHTRSGAAFRAYDAGNVQQVGAASPPSATGAAIDGETLAALQQLAPALAMLTERLSRPISASVNMYGRDGLYESMGRAQQFMKNKG